MMKFLIVALIIFFPSNVFFGQQQVSRSECQPAHRFERGCGTHCLSETAINIGGLCTEKPDDILVVRLCSKEPLLLALYTSAAYPLFVASYLIDFYGYSPERIILLRSENCLGSDAKIAATEFWVIPKGGAMPESVESIKYSQLRVDSLAGFSVNANDYRVARRELPNKLNKSPESVGIIVGYYIKEPAPAMKARLDEITKALEKEGIPRNRYFVRLTPWLGEVSESPPEPERKYPSIFVIEVAKS